MSDKKYFDINTKPIGNIAPLPANKIKPKGTRRKYSHVFSADRQLKKVVGKNGQTKWRRVPAGSLVFYGKQNTHTRKKSNINKDNL
jgi:hypothetical protein